MLQNPRKTLGFKKNMVYKIPPGGEVNHIQPVAYCISISKLKMLTFYFTILIETKFLTTGQYIELLIFDRK